MCTTIGGPAHAGGSLSSALDQVFSILCQALNILLRNNLGGVGLKNWQINKTIEPAWLCRKSMCNAQGQRSRSHSHILSMVENRLPSHYRAKHLLKDKIAIWSLFVYSSAVFIAFCKFYDKMSLCVFQHELVSGVISSDMWHTWTVTARPPPV